MEPAALLLGAKVQCEFDCACRHIQQVSHACKELALSQDQPTQLNVTAKSTR